MDQPAFLEVGTASLALAGETESGDRHVVSNLPSGVFLAVIDGLGHGPSAADAARKASEIFKGHPGEDPVALMQRCHEALQRTRGVAATVAVIDSGERTLTWAGVGNVDARLFPARAGGDEAPAAKVESVLLRGGIVGYRMPPIRPSTLPLRPGDLLIMATDGIRPNFTDGVILDDSPQRVAERIMQLHRREDDALVLTARYLGETA